MLHFQGACGIMMYHAIFVWTLC